MSKRSVRSRRSPTQRALLLMLVCIVLASAAWSVSSSSARAPRTSPEDLVTPTDAQFFAYAELAKPTYTLPAPSLTPVATETAVEALQPELYAQVVADTPAAEYVPPVQQAIPEQIDSQPPVPGANKSILIDISEQHLYAYEGGTLVYSFVASTGMNNATRVGSFSVLDKIPDAYGATWNIWMPNWLGIYWAGNLQNGIHALPILSNGMQLWAGYLGTPISFGCIVIDTYESQLLYDWAEIGTPVEIQW